MGLYRLAAAHGRNGIGWLLLTAEMGANLDTAPGPTYPRNWLYQRELEVPLNTLSSKYNI